MLFLLFYIRQSVQQSVVSIYSFFKTLFTKFTNLTMNNEKLIELIRSHTELYDLSHPKYSDSTWKEKIWKGIADKLNQTTFACKNRWNYLRDQYRREIQRNKTSSRQAAQKKIKKNNYEDDLRFLQKFLLERDSITNSSCYLSDSSEEDGNDTSMNNEIFKTNQSVNDKIWKKPNNIKKIQSVTTGNFPQPETASTSLMKYLLETKEPSKESDIDPVDAFLKGIGATLKTFDAYCLNLAKSRIFNTVQDIEMSQILNKQSCAPNRYSPPVSSNSLYSNHSQSQSPQMSVQQDNSIFTPDFKNENQQQ